MKDERSFTHAEAYCVMQYASSDGRITERLWNSRDGVTPFSIMAKDEKTELRHVRWNGDKCEPYYAPKPGMRCFVDLTKERAEQRARESVEHWFTDGDKRKFCEKAGMTHEQLLTIKMTAMEEAVKNKAPDIISATHEWVGGLMRSIHAAVPARFA